LANIKHNIDEFDLIVLLISYKIPVNLVTVFAEFSVIDFEIYLRTIVSTNMTLFFPSFHMFLPSSKYIAGRLMNEISLQNISNVEKVESSSHTDPPVQLCP
jgi:hypothetical protein